LRRTSPGAASPAATAVPRAPPSAPGQVARPERTAPRWRDIQWIDFDTDSSAVAEPAAGVPSSPAATHTARPAVPRNSDASPRVDKPAPVAALPRLVPRSSRPPAPIAALPALQPELPGFEPKPSGGSIVVRPRMPVPVLARVVPKPTPNVPSKVANEPPAALSTAAVDKPVLSGSTPREPTARSRWPGVLGGQIAGTGAVLRDAANLLAERAASDFARTRTALRPWSSATANAAANPAVSPGTNNGLDRPPQKSAAGLRLTLPIGGLSRYLRRKRNRRLPALIVLAAVLVALAAYGGRSLLATATTDGTPRAGSDGGRPAGATAAPLPRADKSALAAPLPSPTPPADAATRAALYVARAKAGEAAAQYDLGVLYARGDGLVQDYASAATWFHAAAAQGNVAAEYNLGVLYDQGLGVAKDKAAALNWYRSAADQNHPGAQYNLALAYANGIGTKQDIATAARWYQRAAEQGLAPAMVNLAILFEQGSGVARSLVDAYAWYSVAGERGDAGAKTHAIELFQQFNDRDKARAEGLAATIGAALDEASPPV
jgi:hypothetical protein